MQQSLRINIPIHSNQCLLGIFIPSAGNSAVLLGNLFFYISVLIYFFIYYHLVPMKHLKRA